MVTNVRACVRCRYEYLFGQQELDRIAAIVARGGEFTIRELREEMDKYDTLIGEVRAMSQLVLAHVEPLPASAFLITRLDHTYLPALSTPPGERRVLVGRDVRVCVRAHTSSEERDLLPNPCS